MPAASAVTSACSGDDLLVEHVVEDVAEHARENRDRPDREDRREAPVATGRLRRSAPPRSRRA